MIKGFALDQLDELPTSGANKDRKAALEKAKAINCGRCPYHRRENNTQRKRNPHDKRLRWQR